MSYELLRSIHLFSIAPCVPLGFYLIVFSKKGGNSHRLWGKGYALLITFSSLVSLLLEAHVGPTWLGQCNFSTGQGFSLPEGLRSSQAGIFTALSLGSFLTPDRSKEEVYLGTLAKCNQP